MRVTPHYKAWRVQQRERVEMELCFQTGLSGAM